MNRQFRRRVEREWNKIRLGSACTSFVERNDLFSVPHVLYFQAVKLGGDLMCVYSVGLFEVKDGSGFVEHVTVCHFVSSLFRGLGSVKLGFIAEENLDAGEELDIWLA